MSDTTEQDRRAAGEIDPANRVDYKLGFLDDTAIVRILTAHRLTAQAGLVEALEAIRDGDVPRPIGKQWRADCKPSKNDKCVHDVWMYDDCNGCIGEFIDAALIKIRNEHG